MVALGCASKSSLGAGEELEDHKRRNSNSDRKGHLEELSKKANLMSEILSHLGFRNEHLRKPQDKKIVPAKQRVIWREKFTSSEPKIKLRSILLWKQRRRCSYPETQKIVCLLLIRELQCTC